MTDPVGKLQVAFGRVSEGAAARAALDLMGDELDARQHQLDLVIFRMLEAGEAPDSAQLLSTFAQKHAAWRLKIGLDQRVNASKSAARVLSPLMENQ